MVAVRPTSAVFRSLVKSSVAALHVLSNDQCDIAQKFFAPTAVQNDTINGEPFHDGMTCAPILQHAPAYLGCRVRQSINQGSDHAVVILEVVEAVCRERVKPLTMAEASWEYVGCGMAVGGPRRTPRAMVASCARLPGFLSARSILRPETLQCGLFGSGAVWFLHPADRHIQYVPRKRPVTSHRPAGLDSFPRS